MRRFLVNLTSMAKHSSLILPVLLAAIVAGTAQAGALLVAGSPGDDSVVGTYWQCAVAVNDIGTAAGATYEYINDTDMGFRAVRWNGSGTSAVELDNVAPYGSGVLYSGASAINSDGTVVGYMQEYINGSPGSWRAVRWDASGTAVTELGNLGTDSQGGTNVYAGDINDAGITVGYNDVCDHGQHWRDSSPRTVDSCPSRH